MYTTRTDAEQHAIIDPIEAGDVQDARAEYDIDAIFDEVFEYSTDLQAFVQVTDVEGFWAAVERHAR